MKYLLIITGILWTGFVFAQAKNCDSIVWSKERKLSWVDFRAVPDTNTKDTAQSFIRLYKKWSLRGDTLTITILNYFKPCMAWSRSKNADTLLIHEQGHFDISEYFRRSMIKRLSEQNFKRQTYKMEMQAIYTDIEKQQQEFIALYELKTGYSKNREIQVEWTNKIQALIESLAVFDTTKIVKIITE
ncbi:MAG: hypothetical protein QM737_15895 [Ferruginibacter sp.]